MAPHLLDTRVEAAAPASGSVAPPEVLEALRQLVETRLTARQRMIVELYFHEGLTQDAIAHRLGVSQQTVSRQLFGVIREGRRIGGAIQRLRVLCEKHGIDPDQWV